MFYVKLGQFLLELVGAIRLPWSWFYIHGDHPFDVQFPLSLLKFLLIKCRSLPSFDVRISTASHYFFIPIL